MREVGGTDIIMFISGKIHWPNTIIVYSIEVILRRYYKNEDYPLFNEREDGCVTTISIRG